MIKLKNKYFESWYDMEIEDSQILHKIIELQSSIIKGINIKTMLHENIDFYLAKSGADIITVYMHEEEQLHLDCILEKDKVFAHLLKKYVFDKKNFRWEKFVDNCDKHFSSKIKHDNFTDLYQIFKGFLSKKDATAFTYELQMKNAVMMPMMCDCNKQKIIGYACFFFQSDNEVEIKKLEAVKTSFQTILQTLYDRVNNTFYTKCVRIDEDMKLLTSQEKKIVQKVLKGTSYPEIAVILDISINTLKTHMKHIFYKYNVNSKIELYNKLNANI